jgi:hypothetical protein
MSTINSSFFHFSSFYFVEILDLLFLEIRIDFLELQGLDAKKFQEGNRGPDAYTGEKPQGHCKGNKKHTQFQNLFGNIFLHGFIFTHGWSFYPVASVTALVGSGEKIKNRNTAYHFILKNPYQFACRSFSILPVILRLVSSGNGPVGPG